MSVAVPQSGRFWSYKQTSLQYRKQPCKKQGQQHMQTATSLRASLVLPFPEARDERQDDTRTLERGCTDREWLIGFTFSPLPVPPPPPSPSEIPQISDCEGLKTSQYNQHRENLNGILNNSGMNSLPSFSSFVVEKLFISVTRHLERQRFGHQFPTCRR